MLRRLPVRLALVVLTASACARNGDASSTFSGGPGDPASTGTSSSDTSSSSTSSSPVAVSEDSAASTAAGSTGTFDVGVQPDFEPTPVGCKGKIDFLFLVARDPLMRERQAQLTAAFPQFIETIEAKFADFDYHIM